MKYIMLFGIILLFSCNSDKRENQKSEIQKQHIRSVIANENILTISYSNGDESELILEGEEVEFLISPDSTALIVNIRILSTLQITELYRLNGKGHIDSSFKRNLSSEIWDSVSSKFDLKKDEINFPRTNALNWSKDGSEIILSAKGKTESGLTIDEEFRLKSN